MNRKPSTLVHNGRILLVDGDAAVQASVGGRLRRDGLEVMAARSAAHAMDCLCAGHFDLVIADANTQDQAGLELLRRARQIDPNIVFILTADGGNIASAV
ncbi:MAG: response regulator, partial [Planctomycetaceae bacterium]